MSSHFSRTLYDSDYSAQRDQQITRIGENRLSYHQSANDNVCCAPNGPRANRTGNTGDYNCSLQQRTCIESALQNRGRPDCRKCDITLADKNEITAELSCGTVKQCPDKIDTQYSRLDHPVDDYRGLSTYTLQLDHPLIDPNNWTFGGNNKCYARADKIQNMRSGCNTRLNAKDLYKQKMIQGNISTPFQ